MEIKKRNVGLSKEMRLLRDRLVSAVNAIDALEKLDLAGHWGIHSHEEKRGGAVQEIERRVALAASTIPPNRRARDV